MRLIDDWFDVIIAAYASIIRYMLVDTRFSKPTLKMSVPF